MSWLIQEAPRQFRVDSRLQVKGTFYFLLSGRKIRAIACEVSCPPFCPKRTFRRMPSNIQWLTKLRSIVETDLSQRDGMGIIVGPSHAVRWGHAIDNEILPSPFNVTHKIGEGGTPIWNRTIFEQVFHHHIVGSPIFLISPDFRFGNSLAQEQPVVCGQFYDDHTHIDRDLIRPEIDAIMYRHHVECLSIWRRVFGQDLAIFDWTTLLTACEHITNKKYLTDDVYSNIAYAQWMKSDRPKLGAISWPEHVLSKETTRLRRLTTDRSFHPSGIGYFALHNLSQGVPFSQALDAAEALWRRWASELTELLTPMLTRLGPVVFSGTSNWFHTFHRLLGNEEKDALTAIGLHFPPAHTSGDPQAMHYTDALHIHLTDDITQPKASGNGSAECPFVFQWGAFARNTIAKRKPDTAYLAVANLAELVSERRGSPLGKLWLARALEFENPETFLDAGEDLSPSFLGIAMTLITILESVVGTE
jgi:hypothetical protein